MHQVMQTRFGNPHGNCMEAYALQSCGINVRGVRGLVARRDRLQRAGSRLEERLGLSWSAGQDTGDT